MIETACLHLLRRGHGFVIDDLDAHVKDVLLTQEGLIEQQAPMLHRHVDLECQKLKSKVEVIRVRYEDARPSAPTDIDQFFGEQGGEFAFLKTCTLNAAVIVVAET